MPRRRNARRARRARRRAKHARRVAADLAALALWSARHLCPIEYLRVGKRPG